MGNAVEMATDPAVNLAEDYHAAPSELKSLKSKYDQLQIECKSKIESVREELRNEQEGVRKLKTEVLMLRDKLQDTQKTLREERMARANPESFYESYDQLQKRQKR